MTDTKFSKYFEKVKRATGNTWINILKDGQLEPFLRAICTDPNLSLEDKALIALLCSTGGRISEVLSISKKDFDLSSVDGFLTLKVLKKRRFETRQAKVAQIALPYITELLNHRKPQERLIRKSRFQALYFLKKILGTEACNHMFRHSLIQLMVAKNWSHVRISKAMNINMNTVGFYAHPDQRKEMNELLGETTNESPEQEATQTKKSA